MKLLRIGPKGSEKPAMLDPTGILRDLSGQIDDIAGAVLSAAGLAHLRALDPATLPVLPAGARIGPCVGRIGKLCCVGLNYSDHAAETGHPIPEEPILFGKAVTSVSGPNDDIETPRGSDALDYEIEDRPIVHEKAQGEPCEQRQGGDRILGRSTQDSHDIAIFTEFLHFEVKYKIAIITITN